MNNRQELDFIEYYDRLGIDIRSVACGCAVKVDLYSVVYPALRRVRENIEPKGIIISERRDADIFMGPDRELEIKRRIYDLNDPVINVGDIKRMNPSRAIILVQIYQRKAEKGQYEEMMTRFFNRLASALHGRLYIGKGHSIMTTKPDKEFIMADFVSKLDGREIFHVLNNDTIQIVDPTAEWFSEVQIFPAISNALNDLFSLGCYKNLIVKPVLDFPDEEILGAAIEKAEDYCRMHGIELDYEPLNVRSPLIGATVSGRSAKQPPVFFNELKEGMQVLIHRPIGDLAVINTLLATTLMEGLRLRFEEEIPMSYEELRSLKDRVVEILMEPNFEVAEVINKRLPETGCKFRSDEHIAATTDLSGPGIFTLKELAETSSINIEIDNLVFHSREVARFAGTNYLIPDATSGTNGAIAIIASKQVIEEVISELEGAGYDPFIAGRVVGKGEGRLLVKKEVMDFVSNPQLREKLTIIR